MKPAHFHLHVKALLFLLVTLITASTVANGQGLPRTTAPQNPTSLDRLKPEDFERLDIFTGQLRLNFLLHTISGRGTTEIPIVLRSKGRFTPYLQLESTEYDPSVQLMYLHHGWTDEEQVLTSVQGPGTIRYVGGMMNVRTETIPTGSIVGAFPHQGGCAGCSTNPGSPPSLQFKNGVTLTTLLYTAPDGTIYEFRDTLTGGKPLQPLGSCGMAGPSRGTEFFAADGSGAIFLSDSEIKDPGFHSGLNVYGEQGYTWSELLQFTEPRPVLNGYVKFRDGTVARIENWRTVWLRDRNGNKTAFHYDPSIKNGSDVYSPNLPFGRVIKIVDSLGREVNFTYELNDPTYGLHDRISYNGFGGQTRELRITHKPLEQALRPDQTLSTLGGIYGELLWWQQAPEMFNPLMPAVIWLPDGRQHKILYNNRAEPARIELASGGSIEYEHADGVAQGDPEGTAHKSNPFLYRRVTEKRVYANGGSGTSWTSKMTLSQSTGINNGTEQYVDAITFDKNSGGSEFASSKQRHFFYGQAGRSYASRTMYFPSWKLGKEYKSESIDPSSGVVLRRIETTWEQGGTVGWWYNTPIVYAHWLNSGDPVSYLEPVGRPATNCGSTVTHGNYDPLWNAAADDEPAFNPRVAEIKITLEPASANLVAKQTLDYDQFNNVIDTYDYDFGSGTAGTFIRRTHTDYVTSASYTAQSGPYLRSLPSHKWISSDVNGNNKVALTVYEYDNYANDARHKPLVSRSGITSHDLSFNTSYTTRGNVTGTTAYTNAAAQTGPVTVSPQYDIAGNEVASVDGNGKTTTITFADAFCNGTTCGGTFIANTYAFATGTTSPIPDPSGQFGSTTALGTSTAYDFWTGHATSSTDHNNETTTFDYNEPLDRLKFIIRPSGGGRTDIEYSDTSGNVFVRTLTDLDASRRLESIEYFDGLGRSRETRRYEGGGNYITIKQEYDSSGKVRRVSNPYRPWQSETAIWTTTMYDALGRVVSITTPDSATVNTAYTGNQTILTDQNPTTPRKIKLVHDALDRIKQVNEDPDGQNFLTSYTYDVLGNLINVTQGTQTRTSVYDSLSRLTSETNPESGTFTYTYDNNGNLLTRTDARIPAVTITYAYDALNRSTTVNYSDTTVNPDITRVYDGATKGKGRFWKSYAGGNATTGTTVEHTIVDSYDAMGRALVQRQSFKSNSVWDPTNYQITQAYDLAGNITTRQYPSGRSVTYNYDAAGRLADKDASNLAFTGNLGDNNSRTYSRGTTYSVFGSLSQEQFGTTTAVYNKRFYNSRGQLAEILAGLTANNTSWERGKIINDYSSQCTGKCGGPNSTQSMTDNNGNVKAQAVYVPDNDQASQYVQFTTWFAYDSLNRLEIANGQRWASATGVTDNLWKQTFIYDRWGNRRINTNVANTFGAGVNNKNFTVDPLTNRLGVPGGQPGAMGYDGNGNLTTDTYTGGGARTYDAENRMLTAVGNGGQVQVYTYNADGSRTRRKIDNVELWQIYGIDGELLAEYAANGPLANPLKEYGYRNGQLLVTAASGNGSGSASDVTWTNGIGVSINGNSITRTAAGDAWNAGATSTQMIASGDGYAEFTAAETNKRRSFGLTTSTSVTGMQHVTYAILLGDDGQITIHEGVNVYGVFGTYTTGDKLRVAIEGGVVKYRKNGTLLRTSTLAPTYPLYAGGAPFNNGATVSSAVITAGPQNVSWTSGVGVSINGNSITRTAAGDAWNAGARSTQTIASGDGYAEFTTAETNKRRSFGLTTSTSVTGMQHVTYGIHLGDDGQITIHEGVNVYGVFGTYTTGDKLKVAIESGVVKYRKNGTLLRTSTLAPTYPLYVGGAPFTNGSTVSNAVIGSGGSSSSAGIYWLVADHIGTPRMVLDQTGSLANMKRHDYLPFGEEISAFGGRTTAQGYNVADTTRQSFTEKERDGETGLDYFQARYYSSTQGRFTSVDPSRGSIDITNPQSFNRYSYCLNKPLTFVDPDGEIPLLGNLIGAGTSVASGYLIAKLTGQEYTWKDAAIDAATGAVGVGVLSKARNLYRIARLRKIANEAGMVTKATQKNVERYVGDQLAEIRIKHVQNVRLDIPETSWVHRASVRVTNGTYIDPFTGAVGTTKSAVSHIPLQILPLSEAPYIGMAIGGGRSYWSAVVSGGFSDAQRTFNNFRLISATRVPTVTGNLGTVYVYPDGRQRYVGPLKPRGPGFD